jgi:6-phosphogluconolactonase/glucosamine-6-phosphate isomerase/deaminase
MPKSNQRTIQGMNIRFVTIGSTLPVVDYLASVITSHLESGEHVLWLLAGGSAIGIGVDVAHKLGRVPDGRLTVSLTDERYGPVGHADSNWAQLMSAGFNLPGATLIPTLTGLDQPRTASKWGAELDHAFSTSDFHVGFFGIGPDGHTSGILPHTSAVEAPGTVFAYNAGSYERITTTSAFIKQLDEAVVYAIGQPKWPVLEQLEHEESPDIQPAQILKQLPKLTVFTDRPEKV